MSEPVEREIMPGVFVTDFRTTATAAATAQSLADDSSAGSDAAAAQQESKQKEQADADDDEVAHDDDGSMGAMSSSSRSVAAQAERPANSVYPRDLPNDAEELELELAALEQNMMQLVKSTQILQDELKENPDDQDFIEAVAENRATILRRSDRIQAVRRQLQALAPHRAELAAAAQQPSAISSSAASNEAMQTSPPAAPQPDEQDGGLYL